MPTTTIRPTPAAGFGGAGEAWRRRGLYLAGAWNVVGGASALADPERNLVQLFTSTLLLADPLQAFFFRATWINVIAWGVGYILVGRHPAARGPVLLAGGAGKLAYFGACLALFSSGGGTTMLLVAAILDVIFAGFFAHVLWVGRAGRPAAG